MMSNLSHTTKLLMAATHLYPDDFKADLKERLEHPYKSLSPEFGIDLSSIELELEDAKGTHLTKSVFLFVVSIFVIFSIDIDANEINWSILLLAFFLASIAEFLYLRSAKQKVRKIMGDQNPLPDSDANENNSTEEKNVIISGGYFPFIGAGFELDSWSFTVDLSEPEDKQKPVEKVTALQLHEYIKERLCGLQIEELKIVDELYVNGRDVSFIPHILPNGNLSKPVSHVEHQYVLSKVNCNDKRERHYRVVRIPMWDGQVLLSVYFRFLVINDYLFCEARFFLLTPLKDKYLQIENIPLVTTWREFRESVLKAIFKGIFSWILVLIQAFNFIFGGFLEENRRFKEWKREVRSNRRYNYGWEKSLREKWSSESYERYFQKVDKDVSQKLLTNELLSGLIDYLSKKNISTEQFKQTSTKIINEGVMITGGEIKTESFAVGKGAKIAKNAIKGQEKK